MNNGEYRRDPKGTVGHLWREAPGWAAPGVPLVTSLCRKAPPQDPDPLRADAVVEKCPECQQARARTALDDAVQFARDWVEGYEALMDGFGESYKAGGYLTVVALLDAVEKALPHLIDTRRLARALTPPDGEPESGLYLRADGRWWADNAGYEVVFEAIGEALDAAEREARQ